MLRVAIDEPARATTDWRGHAIAVEVRGGESRYPGTELETQLPTDIAYGYMEGKPAVDGDSLDVLLGPDFDPNFSGDIYVATQLDPSDGSVLQAKICIGFASEENAVAAFRTLWPDNMLGDVETVDSDTFERTVLPGLMVSAEDARTPTAIPDALLEQSASNQSFSYRRSSNAEFTRNFGLGDTPSEKTDTLLYVPGITLTASTSSPQNLANGCLRNTKTSANLLLRPPLGAKTQGFIDAPARTPFVSTGMFSVREKLEVSERIVEPVTVDMMHNLIATERTSEVTLHDDTMLHSRSTTDRVIDPTVRSRVPREPIRPRDAAGAESLAHYSHRLGTNTATIPAQARTAASSPDVIVWHKLRIVLEARGGDQRPTGDEQQLPLEFRGLGYFEGLADRSDRDGQELDVIVGPGDLDGPVFLAVQLDDKGGFRQFKSFIGFTSSAEVEGAFCLIWRPDTLGGVWSIPAKRFRKLVLPRLTKRSGLARQGDLRDRHAAGRAPFLEQCDRLRRDWSEGEAFWQAMMGAAKPVDRRAFEGAVDLSGLLDEDESLDEYMADDPDAGTYVADVQGHPVYYLQTSGFEFIFGDPSVRTLWGQSKRQGERRTAILQLEVDPHRIEPPHGPKNRAKLERLISSMREAGWNGRQILVYRSGGQYQALTGSHRLAAARAAGLDRIPVLLIEDSDFDEASYTALDESTENYGRLKALDGLLKVKPETKPAYELLLRELAEKHNVNTRTSALERHVRDVSGANERHAEKVTRKQYRQMVHRCSKAKLLGEIEGLEVYAVDGAWIRDNIDLDFQGAVAGGAVSWVPTGEVWVDKHLDDKDMAACLVRALVVSDDLARGGDEADADEAGKLAETEFREAWQKGKSPFKQVERWFSQPQEVSAEDVPGFDEAPIGPRQAARRKRRKRQRDRVYRPTWYLPEGGRVAFTGAFAGRDVEGCKAVTLRPGARVLQLSEDALRRGLVRQASADGDGSGGRDAELIEVVRAQTRAIERLCVAFEKLRAANGGAYDAIQTEDRLIVLDPQAVVAEPERRRWLNASVDGTRTSRWIEVAALEIS